MEGLSALAEELKLYNTETDDSAAAAAVADAPAAEPTNDDTGADKAADTADDGAAENPDDKGKSADAPSDETPAKPVEEKAPKTVPLAALLEERDKRQKLELELATTKARNEERERLEAQQRANQEAAERARQQPQVDPVKASVEQALGARPSEQEDPVGAAEWDQRYKDEKRTFDDAAYRQRTENELLTLNLANERTAFMAEHPDYNEALKWTIEREVEDYTEMGVPRDVALAEVNRRAGELIMIARRAGKNVAATFYNYAHRRGYVRAAPAATETKPAVEQPKPPTAEEKLQTVKEGQQKGKSLSGGAGGQTVAMSEEQIEAMSPWEFQEWMKTPKNAARYRRMLGAE